MIEDSLFLKVMGDNPMNRILDFLIVFQEFDYNLTDIAKFSKVSYSTLMQNWDMIEEKGIVVYTRTVGKSKMYKFNAKNPVMKKFKEFYWAVVNQQVSALLKKTEKTITIQH